MWNPFRLARQALCRHRFMTVWAGREESDVCLACGRKSLPTHSRVTLRPAWRIIQRHKVVLADDNAAIRRSFTEILAAEYDVVAAVENGEQLLEAATALKPDLLVIDVSMPVLNGLEALQKLKGRGIAAKPVMLSAHSDPAYVRRAFQVGAAGYVLKSAGVEDLPVALRTVLKGETFTSREIECSVAAGRSPSERRRD